MPKRNNHTVLWHNVRYTYIYYTFRPQRTHDVIPVVKTLKTSLQRKLTPSKGAGQVK